MDSNLAEVMNVRLLYLWVVQLAVSATSWSVVQSSPTGSLPNRVWSIDLKTRRPRTELGCTAKQKMLSGKEHDFENALLHSH